ILGLRFDPSSTVASPKLWVSRSLLGDNTPDFQGTISVLTRTAFTHRDVIVHLPRSLHDHMTNGIDFGPDGRLYIAQGATTGYGLPDDYWGPRGEEPLTAAILVADVNRDARLTGGTV